MLGWIKKWSKQKMPLQWLIFNYAIYLLIIIITTVFVYARLDSVRVPNQSASEYDSRRDPST